LTREFPIPPPLRPPTSAPPAAEHQESSWANLLPDTPLLTRAQLLKIIPVTYPVIWDWIRKGEFPRAIKIGKHKVAWRRDEVIRWLEGRERQRLLGDKPNNPTEMLAGPGAAK